MPRSKDNSLPSELGSARRADNVKEKSAEWHELRAGGLGGSEIAAVVGCSPWRSAVTLWAEKTGLIERQNITSEAAEWGTLIEPAIITKFENDNPEFTVYRDTGSWYHVDRPWQISNPDAIFYTGKEWGIFEAKTAAYEDDWIDDDGTYIVPAYYLTQVQWYLLTFGFELAYVGVKFENPQARKKYVCIEVRANAMQQSVDLALAEQFREAVLTKTQPDYDGSSSTLETVRKLNPELTDTEVELGELGTHYQLALVDFQKAEEHLNQMKSRVLALMADAKRGTIDGVTIVTRQARNGGLPYLVNKKGK